LLITAVKKPRASWQMDNELMELEIAWKW